MNVSCKRINPYWHGTIYLKYISISIDWSEQLRSRGIFVEDAVTSSKLVVHQEGDMRDRKQAGPEVHSASPQGGSTLPSEPGSGSAFVSPAFSVFFSFIREMAGLVGRTAKLTAAFMLEFLSI